MTKLDFTKVKWAGMNCILITCREHSQEPILLLEKADIERMLKVWKEDGV